MAVCPKCGEENPERARFCLACGTQLAESAAPREVRKTVSVLFCDVTGSTALGERLDPESLRRVLGRYFDEAKAVLERHGGTVEKFIGDAVMAVFGVPVLHEDDALRAVRAAAELRDTVAGLRDELGLDVRIGVNTGEVVTSAEAQGQKLVTGDAVNVAARLEQAAPPGEVLLGHGTYSLVRDAVEVEPAESLALKGKSLPVEAFRLIAVSPGAAAHERRLDSAIVGRDDELSLLSRAFDRVLRERACHLFTVLGPAGVGKSRLVAEFVRSLGGRATVAGGRCLSYGDGITFWPLAEAIRQLAGEDSLAMVAKLVEGEPEAELIAQRVSAALGLTEVSGGGEETLWAVRKLFEAHARDRPLVLVFDDIQWAEPTFLDLLEHVADWSRDAPILLVCVARPELLDVRPAWGGGKLNATSILLEALSQDECELLIENLLGASGLEEAARTKILEAADGNPLFVEEMLGMLIDDGQLVRENGRWVTVADLARVSVPPTIHALLSARLDRLAADERDVIERASVEGKVFHRGAVEALAPGHDVLRNLMTLVRKELIRPDQAELPGEDAFRFRHLLIRDAAYDALPKQTRAELHERFADWLEQVAGDRVREYDEIVGYHLEQAHRYKSELGPLDEDLASRAADRLERAGLRAWGRGDIAASANLLGRAVALRPPDPSETLVVLARALGEQGEFDRSREVIDDAVERARRGGDRRLELHARLEQALLASLLDPEGSMAELDRVVDEALPVFEELGDDAGLASTYGARSWFYSVAHRFEQRQAAVYRAIEHARRAGDQGLEVQLELELTGTYVYGPLPVQEGILRCEKALARPALNTRVRTSYLSALGLLTVMGGRLEEGFELLADAQRTADERGWLMALVASGELAAIAQQLAGRNKEAEATIRPGYELLENRGEKGLLSTHAARVAELVYRQGRHDEALHYAKVSKELGSSEDVITQVLWRQVRAKVLASRGESKEAERLAREAVTLGEPTDALMMRADALADLGEVLRLAGKSGEAREAYEQALALYEQKGIVPAAERARESLTLLPIE